jgi:hypothetical protein
MIPDELYSKKARKARRCCYSQQPFYASSYVFGNFQPVMCISSFTEPVCGKYILYVPSYFILSTFSTNSLLRRALWPSQGCESAFLESVNGPGSLLSFNADQDPDFSFHFIADPDPGPDFSFYFNVDSDPTFNFNGDLDPDPAPQLSDANLRPLV